MRSSKIGAATNYFLGLYRDARRGQAFNRGRTRCRRHILAPVVGRRRPLVAQAARIAANGCGTLFTVLPRTAAAAGRKSPDDGPRANGRRLFDGYAADHAVPIVIGA